MGKKNTTQRENRPYRIACLIAIVVVWLNAGAWAAVSKAQTPKYIDYVAELNKLGMAGRAESDNAAPFYQKAVELYVKFSPQQPYPTTKDWPGNLPEKELSALKNWVGANSQALSQLELGTKKPYCWFKLFSPDGTVLGIPPLGVEEYKGLILAMTTRAKLAAAEGKTSETVKDILTCYRFGLHLTGPGPKPMVDQLIGIGTRLLGQEATFDILNRTNVDRVFLKFLEEQMEQLSTNESYIPDFQESKFALFDAIQRIIADDGKGDGQIDLEVIKKNLFGADAPDEDVAFPQRFGQHQATETAEKLFKYLDFIAQKTPWQWKAENINPFLEIKKITQDNYVVWAFAPAGDKIVELFARCRAGTGALTTTVAILRYKADKDQFPEKLDELVTAGYIKALASDPYSGRLFVYKRVGGDFTLYSFGPNFQDDGGKVGLDTKGQPRKWVDNGDTVFWPVSSGQETTPGATGTESTGSGQMADKQGTIPKPEQRRPRPPQPTQSTLRR